MADHKLEAPENNFILNRDCSISNTNVYAVFNYRWKVGP